jgi:hypothetical protein
VSGRTILCSWPPGSVVPNEHVVILLFLRWLSKYHPPSYKSINLLIKASLPSSIINTIDDYKPVARRKFADNLYHSSSAVVLTGTEQSHAVTGYLKTR